MANLPTARDTVSVIINVWEELFLVAHLTFTGSDNLNYVISNTINVEKVSVDAIFCSKQSKLANLEMPSR